MIEIRGLIQCRIRNGTQKSTCLLTSKEPSFDIVVAGVGVVVLAASVVVFVVGSGRGSSGAALLRKLDKEKTCTQTL